MRIALIDGDFLPYYVCHNKKLEDGTKESKSLQECKDLLDSFVQTIMVNSGASHYIMALTVGKCFRYQVNTQYKANRKYDDAPEHLSAIKWYLRDNYNGIFFEGLEADDIVNICNKSTWFIGENSEEITSFIVSPDKDLLMLEGRNYNPKKHEWVEVSKDQANLYFWTSMITGDNIDGIKGIPRKGKKFAEELLQSGENCYDDVLSAYIDHFGEYKGIEEFYKNYKCLKILDSYEGFQVPEPIKFSVKF